MKLEALAFVLFLALAPAARADWIVLHATAGPFAVGASGTADVPQFDPALGVLRRVEVSIHASVTGSWSVENTNAQPTFVFGYGSGQYVGALVVTALGWPALNPAFIEDPTYLLPAFDGTLDFAGPSATTRTFVDASGDGNPSSTWTLLADAQIEPYVGTGARSIAVGPIGDIPPNAPPGVASTHSVGAELELTVRYEYDPLPAKTCSALPSSGCPCSNSTTIGRGCANSANAQGGTLDASGTSSLSNDTLVLAGSGMTDGTALYFQGTAFGYVQSVYGDGLRCVGGMLVRLGTKSNSGGASQYPAAGDPSVSVRGLVAAPGTRHYQVIYRDGAGFCTPSPFNVTSAYALVWAP